jgi:hypothetical protein
MGTHLKQTFELLLNLGKLGNGCYLASLCSEEQIRVKAFALLKVGLQYVSWFVSTAVGSHGRRTRSEVHLKHMKCQVVFWKLTRSVFMTTEHSARLLCGVIKPTSCSQWLVYYKGVRFQHGEQRILLSKNLPI